MDTSELFAVEYNRDKREWRVDTLDKVLEANYKLDVRSNLDIKSKI